ncbi:unnamed protein product [Rotaria magnacalcarata]
MSAIKRRRGLYSKQQLIDAVRAVKEGEMTSVKAADEYKVPAGTIRFHVNNDSLRIGGGRSFYLSSKQEDYLVELIKSFETIGVPLTKIALRMIVGQYIKLVTNDSRYKKNQPSIHWLKKFLVRRKKEIKMVKEKQIEKSRRDGFTEDVRSGWFSNLKEVLDKNDLLYKPLQIWNMDESGFSDETQIGPVSGGFRRAGIFPYNKDAMKEKVVPRRSSYNNLVTNNSSAMDILTSLLDVIGSSDVHVNSGDDPSTSSQTAINSTSASSRPQLTFDDNLDDELYQTNNLR